MTACYALNPADLPALLTVWRKNAAVLYPCKEEGDAARLADYEPLMPVSLDYGNLSMPAVDILNGYQDVLFHWNGNERTYEARPGTEDGRPTVLFGIRPCDVAALSYLDEFYLGEYADLNYSRRREALTIVAVNCTQPGKTCFCAATQTGPFARSGYDLLLTPDGDTCWVECATARGEALIAQGAPFFRSVPTADLKARQLMLEEQCRAAFPPLPDMSDARNALLRGFHHPLWDELTPTCIACTGCTAVCPTCTCFQFNEERLSPTSGRRVRVKDSCQAPGFTRNAGGHNPRSKAGAVLSLLHLIKNSGLTPDDIDFVVDCSEEAAGDINQRGGGNMAKAIAESAGCSHASGFDVRAFCAAPGRSILLATMRAGRRESPFM